MKRLFNIFQQFFSFSQKEDSIVTNHKGFFDYSAGEKIKIMRAAGREAQKEQSSLVKDYDNRFGRI